MIRARSIRISRLDENGEPVGEPVSGFISTRFVDDDLIGRVLRGEDVSRVDEPLVQASLSYRLTWAMRVVDRHAFRAGWLRARLSGVKPEPGTPGADGDTAGQ